MRSDQPRFQSYRGRAEVEMLRPHPVGSQDNVVSLASSACDTPACLRAGSKFMSDGQAGGAPDDFISSPAEFGHPNNKTKIGEPARRRKLEKKRRDQVVADEALDETLEEALIITEFDEAPIILSGIGMTSRP